MSMTDEQYAWLVANTGDVNRPDADAAYDRLVTLRAVAVERLQTRLTRMTSGPDSVTIPGVVSVSSSGTMRAIQASIDALLAGPEDPSAAEAAAGGSALTVVPLVSRWARAGAYVGHGARAPYVTVRNLNDDLPA